MDNFRRPPAPLRPYLQNTYGVVCPWCSQQPAYFLTSGSDYPEHEALRCDRCNEIVVQLRPVDPVEERLKEQGFMYPRGGPDALTLGSL